jgi:hypothetical protein
MSVECNTPVGCCTVDIWLIVYVGDRRVHGLACTCVYLVPVFITCACCQCSLRARGCRSTLPIQPFGLALMSAPLHLDTGTSAHGGCPFPPRETSFRPPKAVLLPFSPAAVSQVRRAVACFAYYGLTLTFEAAVGSPVQLSPHETVPHSA